MHNAFTIRPISQYRGIIDTGTSLTANATRFPQIAVDFLHSEECKDNSETDLQTTEKYSFPGCKLSREMILCIRCGHWVTWVALTGSWADLAYHVRTG